MKVLYISKAMLVSAYRDKAAALAERTELTLLLPDRWGRRRMETGGMPLPRLRILPGILHGHNHLHLYRGVASLLDEVGPDLVHIDEEPYSAVTYQVARLARKRRIPSIFFAWQNLSKRLPPPFESLRTRVFSMVAGGIAGTEGAANVLRAAGFAGPLATIPQIGVHPDRFTPDPERRASTRARIGAGDEFVVGYGGRLVPEKGLDVLLRATARMNDARVVLLGDGPDRPRLERLAGELGLGERALFVGEVPSCSVPEWLPGLDVLVLPSRESGGWSEQFGRILVEAMACAVPVLGARTGEIPGVVGDAGLLFSPSDPEALATAIAHLASRPALRRQLGDRGRQRVLDRYTQDGIADRTVGFYRAVFGSSATAAA